jgi:hypothetical protein
MASLKMDTAAYYQPTQYNNTPTAVTNSTVTSITLLGKATMVDLSIGKSLQVLQEL